jgi:hypothetical protein
MGKASQYFSKRADIIDGMSLRGVFDEAILPLKPAIATPKKPGSR